MERDRLKRKYKKQALRNAILVFLGVGIVGVLLFMFGAQLLISFSLLLGSRNSNDTANITQDINYIASPDLAPLESATNSASITISGSTTVDKSQVKIYVNGVLDDTTRVNSKNEFSVKNVTLEEGENEIKAKTVTEDNNESDFSTPMTITYKNKAPELTIEYPQDGQTVKNNQLTLRGKTDAGSKVTVNGFWAIVNSEGNFSYNIKLNDGDNTLKLQVTDSAGNKSEKDIHVTFSP